MSGYKIHEYIGTIRGQRSAMTMLVTRKNIYNFRNHNQPLDWFSFEYVISEDFSDETDVGKIHQR